MAVPAVVWIVFAVVVCITFTNVAVVAPVVVFSVEDGIFVVVGAGVDDIVSGIVVVSVCTSVEASFVVAAFVGLDCGRCSQADCYCC